MRKTRRKKGNKQEFNPFQLSLFSILDSVIQVPCNTTKKIQEPFGLVKSDTTLNPEKPEKALSQFPVV